MIKVPLQSESWLPLTAPYQWNTWLANIQMFHVMGHAIKYVKKKYSELEEFNHLHMARPMIVWNTKPKILHAQNRRAANVQFAAFQENRAKDPACTDSLGHEPFAGLMYSPKS